MTTVTMDGPTRRKAYLPESSACSAAMFAA